MSCFEEKNILHTSKNILHHRDLFEKIWKQKFSSLENKMKIDENKIIFCTKDGRDSKLGTKRTKKKQNVSVR